MYLDFLLGNLSFSGYVLKEKNNLIAHFKENKAGSEYLLHLKGTVALRK